MRTEILAALIAAFGAIITTIAGVVGGRISKYYEIKANTAAKKRVVEECVAMAEQLYHDLCGAEKKERAADAIVERLNQEGIPITALELEHMIEAAVAAFNDAFKKQKRQ